MQIELTTVNNDLCTDCNLYEGVYVATFRPELTTPNKCIWCTDRIPDSGKCPAFVDEYEVCFTVEFIPGSNDWTLTVTLRFYENNAEVGNVLFEDENIPSQPNCMEFQQGQIEGTDEFGSICDWDGSTALVTTI
jgi:hypothetical protein